MIAALLVVEAQAQFFNSKTHSYVNRINGAKEVEFRNIGNDLQARFRSEGWFRIAQFNMNYDHRAVPGSLRPYGLPESSIYDNGVSRYYRNFHYNVIHAGKFKPRGDVSEFLPYPYYPLSVHRALGIPHGDVLQESYFRNALTLDYPYDDRVQFLWDLTQTRYILKYRGELDSPYLVEVAYYPEHEARLYRNENARPTRFGIANEIILNDSNSESLSDVRSAFKNTQPATPEEINILPDSGDNRVVLRVKLGRAALLVNYESWNPHWKATIDGTPAEVLRAFHFIRAIRVPAGEHRIDMEYEVPGFRIASVVAILGWLAAVTLLIREFLRKR